MYRVLKDRELNLSFLRDGYAVIDLLGRNNSIGFERSTGSSATVRIGWSTSQSTALIPSTGRASTMPWRKCFANRLNQCSSIMRWSDQTSSPNRSRAQPAPAFRQHHRRRTLLHLRQCLVHHPRLRRVFWCAHRRATKSSMDAARSLLWRSARALTVSRPDPPNP